MAWGWGAPPAPFKGPLRNSPQRRMGHAQLTTTAIYADAVGAEEQSIAVPMW
jgi:hypothetical protein